MPAKISVVIPTLNAAQALPETANALLPGVGDGLIRELVVSDGGSDDETLNIARELGAAIVTGPSGRGPQIARGVDAARAPWLLILHADTHLSGNWPSAARAFMADHPDKAGWFRLRFRAEGWAPRLVASGANMRSSVLSLPYGDQGLLIHKVTLAEVGGVPKLPLMEDVALAKKLKGRLLPVDAEAQTSAERYQRDGWVPRAFRNLKTLLRYQLGADPAELAAEYGRPRGR